MSLPPLANVFAFSARDPSLLRSIEMELAGSGEFAEIWRPGSGWVAASQPLPGGEADGHIVRAFGLAFVEGRDVVLSSSRGQPSDLLREVVDTIDRSPERLASLPGDFGFIRFRDLGSATVVRSCGGLVPFYLRRTEDCVAVCTRLGDLVRYFPAESELDPLVNAAWASGHGVFPDRRTFLSGVSILARGHFARIEPERPPVFRRYWNPRPSHLPRPSTAEVQEHSQRLRSLLIQHLTRDLDPEGGNLLTLSGGVDSSSLAALARGAAGRRMWTFSLLPAPQDLFDHEMSYIQPLANRFGFERQWSIRVHADTPIQLLHSAPPVVFHVVHPALCALPRITREAPVRVLFGGEFADEVCGAAVSIPDWAASTPIWRLGPFARLPSSRQYVVSWAKARLRSLARRPLLPFSNTLAVFIQPDLQEEYCEWFTRMRRQVVHDSAPLAGLAARCEADGFVTMNWEAASALGVRRSFPFFNRDVLELAFECHPSELIGPLDKKLLRAALRDDVPERNLNRPDKGAWGAYLREGQSSWDTALPEALQMVVRPEWFPSPPSRLARWDAWGLTQLVVFLRALELTRLPPRGLQKGPSPSSLNVQTRGVHHESHEFRQ